MPASEPVPVTAAGGVVYRLQDRISEVLLIFRNGKWDLPKGKHEEGESVEQCAVREVAEETGASLPILISSLHTTYHTYREKDTLFGKTTYWYSMVFPKTEALHPQQEEGITSLEWVPLAEALTKVDYDNLRVVLNRFQESMKKQ